jgi:DNA replication and repair protein RecF
LAVRIRRLRLQNFRSYQQAEFRFSPNTTLIVGPNTSGKTNLLEAIYFLAHGQSWRPGLDRELIRWDEVVGRVRGEVEGGGRRGEEGRERKETIQLEIVLTRGEVGGKKVAPKKYLVNGAGKRKQDFLDHFAVVLFSPEDIRLILNSPSTRRDYLDAVLEGVDARYRRRKLEYEKALRARNSLLDLVRDGKARMAELEYWNSLLVSNGEYLTQKRKEFIGFVNQEVDSWREENRLNYEPSEVSLERLRKYQRREIAFGATLIGPHRDDFKFVMEEEGEELNLSVYGSRSQQRLAIFWLKLRELNYVLESLKARPVLVLDDLFSELDRSYRNQLLKIIPHQQTILTTTDLGLLDKDFLSGVEVIELNSGSS